MPEAPSLVARAAHALDRWVPPNVDGVWRFRGRVIVGTSFYVTVVLWMFTPIWWWWIGPGIGAGCLALAIGMLAVGPAQRLSGSVVFGANLLLLGCYLLEAWAIGLTGGIGSPFMGVAWIPVLYAGVLLGFRGGLWHAAFVSGATALLAVVGDRIGPALVIDSGVFSIIAVPPAALTCALLLALLERYGARALAREAIARERAEQASRAKSEFLGIVSHELRSPLAGILGAAELLGRRRLDDGTADLARTISSCGLRLSTLVEDLLDMRVAEAGQLVLSPTSFSPRAVAEQVLAIAAGARSGAGPVTLTVADDVPDALWGDASRVHQVLLNLVANAVRYGAGRPVLVRLSGRLRVEVTDHGPGIAPEDFVRVFEPFIRLDSSYRRLADGTGLGLAISRHLVQAMGGEIGVRSTLGDGATFWFEVPLEPSQPASVSSPPSADPLLVPARALDVLVVDDQDSVREVFVQMFQALGHRVAGADGVLSAMARCEERRFDVIFLDISMPEIDGIEGSRRLRALPHPAVLVALTANATPADRAHYLAVGFDDVVSKPATLADLRGAVDRATAPA